MIDLRDRVHLLAANSIGVEEMSEYEFVVFSGLCKPFRKRFDPLY